MRDIPIIFSSPMARALLDGRKTMTRRLRWTGRKAADGEGFRETPWARVQPGDRLWVRETIVPCSSGFEYDAAGDDCIDLADLTDEQVEFWNKRAGDDPDTSRKVSPIHMPRWASRLTLIVTATKIERLQGISLDDAQREGIQFDLHRDTMGQCRWASAIDERRAWSSPLAAFEELWKHIHGEGAWDANPEVIAMTFTVHKQNIDALPQASAA